MLKEVGAKLIPEVAVGVNVRVCIPPRGCTMVTLSNTKLPAAISVIVVLPVSGTSDVTVTTILPVELKDATFPFTSRTGTLMVFNLTFTWAA